MSKKLQSLLLLSAFLIVSLTVARLIFSWSNGSQLDHVAGSWTTLALDLTNKIFYRPLFSEEIGYGGTQYTPLYFVLHAVLLLVLREPIISGFLLSLMATSVLLLGVFLLLRRLGAERNLALIFTVLVLTSYSVQNGLTTIKGDLLSTALNVWGVLFCIGSASKQPRILVGAVFFSLAFATKLTSIHGSLACMLWLFVSGYERRAYKLVAFTASGFLIVLGLTYLASDGRVFEIMKVCSSAGALSWWAIAKSPLNFLRWFLRRDLASLLYFFVALATFIVLPSKEKISLASLLFGTSIIITIFIYGAPGAGFNHLIDVHIASLIILVYVFSRKNRYASSFQLASVAIASVISLVTIFDTLKTEDFQRTRFKHIYATLASIGKSHEEPILSEDPLVPILGKERVYLLDSFMLVSMTKVNHKIAEQLFEKIRGREFRAIVLLDDPRSEQLVEWKYDKMHFGKGFVEQLLKNYYFYERNGGYFLFLPIL